MVAANLEEYRSLKDMALALEKLLSDSPPGINPMLESVLANIQKRIEALESEIKQDEIKIRAAQAAEIAVAEKEAALNASERGIFLELMRKDYFAKADMPQVNSFYKNVWDKLTDDGKDKISHRLWESVRHGEQKFSELADAIKEKEAERLHKLFINDAINVGVGAEVPEKDWSEFIRAYESGNKEEAYRILDRPCFTKSVSLNDGKEIKSESSIAGRDFESQSIKIIAANQTRKAADDEGEKLPSIGDLDFKNLKLNDASTPSVAAITLPSAGGERSL